MFAAPFDYYRPTTIDQALQLLRDVPDARVLAGGHSLIPAMKLRMSSPAALIDIGRIPQLKGIESTPDGLRIGALTTHSEVAASELVRTRCPVLASTAAAIGDLQVRNRGTIGGSVAHADPGADYPTVLLMLGATFHTSTRDIPVDGFFVDFFTTALQPGELLTAVTVPSTEGASAIYLKHRHPASSFAVVGVAAMTRGAETRIAIGGVTPTPVRVSAAEAVAESLQNPLGDSYASGEFRLHLAQLMTRRALSQLASQLAS